jgi:hypothetical protein
MKNRYLDGVYFRVNVALRCRIMNIMIFVHGVEIKLRGGNNENYAREIKGNYCEPW